MCRTRFLVILALGCFPPALFVPRSTAMSRSAPRYVTVSDAMVLRPPHAAAGIAEASAELARHLELVLGRPVPIREGTPAQWELGGARPFAFILLDSWSASSWSGNKPVPAGYSVGARAVWLTPGAGERRADAILTAVYAFLERECGVRWFAPGDAWTVRLTSGPLRLRQTSVWVRRSEAASRIRVVLEGAAPEAVTAAVGAGLPEELRPTPEIGRKRRAVFRTWLRRHGLAARPAPAKGTGPTVRLPSDLGLPLTSVATTRTALDEVRTQLDAGGTVDLLLPSPSWDLSGPALYALVRGLERPDEPLETWIAEYSLAFGSGAFQVRQYFRYWRDRMMAAVGTHRAEVREMGWGDPTLGTYRFLGKELSRDDFTKSAAFLHAAFDDGLGPNAKRRLEHLLLAHAHARLIATVLQNGIAAAATPEDLDTALEAARRLASFRREFRSDLRCCLPCLALRELRAGDVAGTLWRKLFDGVVPAVRLPEKWHFRVDPDERGASQEWQNLPWPALAKWPTLRTDRPWEFATGPIPLPGDGGMAGYDGSGWYATAFDVRPAWRGCPAFLILGPSEDARTVYINGKRILESNPDATAGVSLPLRIRIDPFFTREALHQVVVIRLRDSGGPGGLRNPAWVCLRPATKQAKTNAGNAAAQPSPADDGATP